MKHAFKPMLKPANWRVGPVVPQKESYGDPPAAEDPRKILIYGLMDGDPGHRLYELPADTPVRAVVETFRVGSHGAMSYSYDEEATVRLVATKATKIAELIPCRVIFADSAGLKLKFLRPVEDADLDRIEALFPEKEAMQSGLEAYISEQQPGQRLLARVKKDNLFHFWWD